MIPGSNKNSAEVPIEVIISAEHETNVILTSPYPGIGRDIDVKPPGMKMTLPAGVALNGTGIQQKAILVESTMNISVYVFHEDGYFALPSQYLGSNYVITISGNYGNSMVAIAAIDGPAKVDYTYENGSFYTVYIPVLSVFYVEETWYLVSDYISSNATIAVVAGHTQSFNANRQGLTQMESLIPIAHWGKRYIIPPIQNASKKVEIVYNPKYNSSISFQGVHNFVLSNATTLLHRYHRWYIHSERYYSNFVGSDDAIGLVEWQKEGSLFNSFMTLIPALSQYSNNYRFATPSYKGQHFVAVIVQAKDFTGLKLDGLPLETARRYYTVTTLSAETYFVLTVKISSGWHDINHVDPNVRFGLIMYGGNKITAYGLPLGFHLN